MQCVEEELDSGLDAPIAMPASAEAEDGRVVDPKVRSRPRPSSGVPDRLPLRLLPPS